MKLNLLKLNDDKPEFLLLGTKHNISLAGELEIKIGNDTISNSMSAKTWVSTLMLISGEQYTQINCPAQFS